MQYMHIYDLVMLAILLWCFVHGVMKGIAWQIASLAAIFASAFVAQRFSGRLGPVLSNEEPWNRLAAMVILYVATSMGIWFVFRFVKGWINRFHLKEFDRQLGGALGILKGAVLCILVTFFAVMLSLETGQKVLESRSGYFIAITVRHAAPLLPADVHAELGKYIDEFNRRLEP